MATYDKEKWLKDQADKKKEMQNKLKDISDNFKLEPEKLAELSAFSAKFYEYSPHNNKLIYSQNEYASFVGSFQKFKELGYNVKKGEKAIYIYVPVMTTFFLTDDKKYKPVSQATKEEKALIKSGEIATKKELHFKLAPTFDISQTDCPVADYPKIFSMGYTSETHAKAIEDITHYSVNQLNCNVEIKDLSSITLKGFYNPNLHKITLNDKINDTEKLTVLCHELGHAVLHNNLKEYNNNDPSVLEIEADMFSIMLQSHAGIELTDSQKKHFTDHYRALEQYNNSIKKEEDKVDVNELFDKAFNKYQECAKGIEEHTKTIEKSIEKPIKDVEIEP